MVVDQWWAPGWGEEMWLFKETFLGILRYGDMNRYDIYICAVDIFEFHKDNGGTDDENSEQVNVLDASFAELYEKRY